MPFFPRPFASSTPPRVTLQIGGMSTFSLSANEGKNKRELPVWQVLETTA